MTGWPLAQVRRRRVEREPVAVGGQREHDGVGVGDGVGAARRRSRTRNVPSIAFLATSGSPAASAVGARARRRPEQGVMPGTGEKGGGAIGDGAGTENTDAQSVPLNSVSGAGASAGARKLLDGGKLSSGHTPRIERTFFLSRPARGGLFHEDLP